MLFNDNGRYLDIGIVDIMKDLLVDFVGAVVFSIIGIIYLKTRKKGSLAESLIPVVKETEEKISLTRPEAPSPNDMH